ncbi:MAG: hypothetical protein LBQ18_01805 [Campylobacteraceae bacterium]|jgi:hypothetical protein|nr:hypothetical protein [Campylobacteraceae bacterium]
MAANYKNASCAISIYHKFFTTLSRDKNQPTSKTALTAIYICCFEMGKFRLSAVLYPIIYVALKLNAIYALRDIKKSGDFISIFYIKKAADSKLSHSNR